MRHAPHVPVAVLDHQVFAPAAARQVGKEKAVVGRRGQREAGLSPCPCGRPARPWWRRPRSAAARSRTVRAVRRRRIQVLGLADVEHLVRAVPVPVVDLHGQVAVGPAVVLRGRAGLPQDFACEGGGGQAGNDPRAVEVLHKEDVRRAVAVEVADPDRLGQEVLADDPADQVDGLGLVGGRGAGFRMPPPPMTISAASFSAVLHGYSCATRPGSRTPVPLRLVKESPSSRAGFLGFGFEALDDVRVLRGHVGGFADVVDQVVKLGAARSCAARTGRACRRGRRACPPRVR